MPTEQYHEPAAELSQETRTFARMITALIEEAEAINWYEQRISIEQDEDAKKIMEHAQREEFIHFAMDLEFLSRKKEAMNCCIIYFPKKRPRSLKSTAAQRQKAMIW